MQVDSALPSRTERWNYRNDLLAILALIVAIVVVAWYGISTSSFLGRTDIVTQYLPWYDYLGEQLRHGNIPGWIPYSFGGAPFAGDPQSGWGYMPAMLVFSLVPGRAGFETLIVVHFLIAALSSYAFARAIKLGIWGSFVAAAAFTFSGLVERTRCCTIHVEVAVWVPVALLGIELSAQSRTWKRRIAWWGLTGIATSQIIAGWIGVGAAYGLMAVAAYGFYRIILAPDTDQRTVRERLFHSAVFGVTAGVSAAVLAATALIPRLDVVDRSNLAGGSYDGVLDPDRPFNGWTLAELLDRLLTQDDTSGRYYAGATVLALALLAPFLARWRYRIPFFLPFALVIAVLTLNVTIVHRLFFLIPSFERLHEHRPPHILTIFPIGIAILAGASVAAFNSSKRRVWWQVAVAFLPFILIVIVRELAQDPEPPIRLRTVAAVGLVSGTVALGLFFSRRPTTIVASALLALLVLWDPAMMSVLFREQSSASVTRGRTVDTYQQVDEVATFLQEKMKDGEVFRFFGYDGMKLVAAGNIRTYHVSYSQPETMELLVNNRAIQLDLEDIQGYNPVQIKRYVDFVTAINGMEQSYHAANVLFRGLTSPLITYLNVQYVILPLEVPAGRPDLLHFSQRNPTVYRDDKVLVVELTDALPRAWIVHEAVTVDSEEQAIAMMKSKEFDPRTTAILPDDTSLPSLDPIADPNQSQVTSIRTGPDSISLNVSMSGDGMVILSEIWDPGWKVTIDGEDAELYRADFLLRGVAVPTGEHTIELSYKPVQLVVTSWVTGIGWVIVVLGYGALGAGSLLTRRRRRMDA